MKTILEKSVHGNLRNFRTLRWKSSNNLPNSPTGTFWQVRTQYHMYTFIEFMKMKLFYEGLPENLLRMLYDAPSVLKDSEYICLLRAKILGVSEELLESRYNTLRKITGRDPWSKNLFFTYSGNVNYEVIEYRLAIRPGKRYSGYVRSISSIRTKISKGHPEPEIIEWTESYEIDFMKYFTVGVL